MRIFPKMTGMLSRLFFLVPLAGGMIFNSTAADSPAAGVTLFEEKIRPVLAEKCFKCHSERARKVKGELKLDTRAALLKGGETGPAVVPGNLEKSLLITAIRHADEDLKMPDKEKLPATVIRDFERWVKAGAPFPEGGIAKEPVKPWWDLLDTAELLPSDRPIASAVDHYISAKLILDNIKPVTLADDFTFIRRVTLDLCGRIPTVPEIEAFASSKAKDKRVKLVDRLLSSSSFLRHQVVEFDWLLMDGQDKGMRKYLERAFAEGRSWGRIFREIVIARQADEETKGASAFIKERVKDIDRLTNDVSVRFFGVNISCAKCHDHPEVPTWTQDRYYGMKSFFNRTFDNGDFFGERAYGQVSFKTTKGETKQAKLMFLTGRVLDESAGKEPDKKAQDEEKKQVEKFKKEKKPLPPPIDSWRAKLIEAGLRPGEDAFFARAIVNRLWHRLHGHGLVMPLDQLHGQNTPSHPELLQWLARDLSGHDYDLRRTIRGLVLSQSYARGSRWGDSKRPAASYFAVAQPRVLSPHQYGAGLVIASQDPGGFNELKPGQLDQRLEQLERSGHGWAGQFERPGEFYLVNVDEALFLNNSEKVRNDLLNSTGGRLTKRLLETKDTRTQIQTAWLTILSRRPSENEVKEIDHYLSTRKDRLPEAWKQIVWALMTSAEMRFNH
jgi:hypothetical protein